MYPHHSLGVGVGGVVVGIGVGVGGGGVVGGRVGVGLVGGCRVGWFMYRVVVGLWWRAGRDLGAMPPL